MNCEFDNNIPIYIQLVDRLRIMIISEELKAGERIPSVRDLAMTFKVNPNTVQKALTELEEKKIIYTERTNGKFVTTNQKLIDECKMGYVANLAKEYFLNMQKIGFNKKQAVEFLKDLKGEE